MNWLILPIEDLKLIDPNWEDRVKSVDGSKALIHEEIYNELVPQMLVEDLDTTEYPFPIMDYEQVRDLLSTSEWTNEELNK